MHSVFITPTKIITGVGAADALPGELSSLGTKRPIIITTRNWSKKSGWLDKIVSFAYKAETVDEVIVFDGVIPEPTCSLVDEIRRSIKENDCDLVIALGGGSVIDAAKAAAVLVFSEMPTEYHLLSARLPEKAMPIVAIPSTAGTGSEATIAAVLSIPDKSIKQSIKSYLMLPRVAIVDPRLSLDCPADLTAYCGMDALAQAIESLCSRYAYDITDAIAEKAIWLVYTYLPKVYNDLGNIEFRSRVANGSLLSGMALANARLGLVHGLAHPLGGVFRLPHGLLCGLLLPYVLEFNKASLKQNGRYERLSKILNKDPVDAILDILDKLNMPKKLSDLGLDLSLLEENRQFIVENTLRSGSTQANIRPVSASDVENILEQLIA